jgi:hypothetical protein
MDRHDSTARHIKTLFFHYFVGRLFPPTLPSSTSTSGGRPWGPGHRPQRPDLFLIPLVSLIDNRPAGIVAGQVLYRKRLITLSCWGTRSSPPDRPGREEVRGPGRWGDVPLIFCSWSSSTAASPILPWWTPRTSGPHATLLPGAVTANTDSGTYVWSVATIRGHPAPPHPPRPPCSSTAPAACLRRHGVRPWSSQGDPRTPDPDPLAPPEGGPLFMVFWSFVFLSGIVLNASISTGVLLRRRNADPLRSLILGTWTLFEVPSSSSPWTLIDRSETAG